MALVKPGLRHAATTLSSVAFTPSLPPSSCALPRRWRPAPLFTPLSARRPHHAAGERCEQLYLVAQGRISLNSAVHSGRLFQLGEIECHQQIFGEMEFFSATPVQWSVVAETELDAAVICADKLAKRLLAEPELTLFFAAALASDYLDTLDITTSRLLHPHRLQYRLRAVARAPAHPMLGSRKRPTRRRALAPRERVYRRALKELIEQGIVCEGAEGPAIADLARLRAYLDL